MEKLDKKNILDILALTPLQEGMLFHYLQEPQSGLYFEQLSLEISGTIAGQVFEKAWNTVVETNEMLRAVFRWEKVEKPSQIILKEHECSVIFYDLSDKAGGQKKTALEEIKTKDRNEGFDLTRVPFRVILCKLDETKYEMIISNHHILYDGWSNGIILKEFFKAYHELRQGQSLKHPVKPPFKEFLKSIQGQDKYRQEQFWRDYLAGFDTPTELPIKNRMQKTTGSGDYSITLEEDIKNKLEVFIKNNRGTMASIFYTAWGMLLQRYCGSEDVIFGTTVSGRSGGIKGIEDMVGLFINTIPLRTQTAPNEKIIDAVFRTDQVVRDREEFENTPLVDIGSYNSVGGGGALFDTIVVIENYPLDNRLVPQGCLLSIDSYSIAETTHYSLTVAIMLSDELEIKFSFKPELFDIETIENLAGHFKGIIQNMMEKPETALSQFEIISSEEKNRILYEFNNTAAEYPRDKTIHQLFEEQAERTPDTIALHGCMIAWMDGDVGANRHLRVCPSRNARNVSLTYHQLNEQSDRLAGLLIEKGVQPDTIVGIMMERSIEMIIGIMGILKAGGAYLPIDPHYPQERIDYMLKDSNAATLLINNEEKIIVNSQLSIVNCQPNTLHHHSNLAYLIYTSGSTGRPKGVMINHSSVVNLLFAMQNRYPVTSSDTYLLKTSYTFDVSVTELFGWFMGNMGASGGGKLVILEMHGEKDPQIIFDWIYRHHVTHINFVPSMFNSFLDFVNERNKSRLRSLKYIFLAGEALLPSQVKNFADLNTAIALENLYGPTEGTVYSSHYSLSKWNGFDTVPIGKPLPNIKLYILNKYNHLQPVGIPGELYIGGEGTARGYLNRPELTAEKFIFSPNFLTSSLPNFLLYRSGDLTRRLPDGPPAGGASGGVIEFLGRIDQQIKIRGFRVELGEIENRLLKHEQVKDAVVLVKEDAAGDKYLAAYFVSEIEIPGKNLMEYLAKDLPGYMLPSYFMRLAKIPLSPSGKVDRKALPEPELQSEETYVAPRNDIEKKLVEIWGKVLGKNLTLNPVGIDDHFFRLGGHSLKATSLAALVHKTFDVKIPLGEIFKRPTIRQLFGYINNAVKEQYRVIEPVEKREYYPLSSAQKRLYFLQQMDNAGAVSTVSTVYNMPSVWMLEGEPDKIYLEKVFNKLINRHESLRTSFIIIDEEPVQRIHDEVALEIEKLEDRGDPLWSPFIRPFDLSKAPLLRVGLLKEKEEKGERHFLLVDMHHIISDGTSLDILVKDFMALYQGADLPGLQVQYKDFARWQNHEKQKELLKPRENYWVNEFVGEMPVLELPLDYPRPPVQSFAGSTIHFEIDSATTGVLNGLALKTDATLYMILLAVYTVFLAKITNQEDIVVGSPIAGRRHADLEKIIGMFVNTLAMRNFPSGEKTFTGFLREVKEKTLRAFENQDTQFEDLVERIVTDRDTSRNPVFDVMFVLQNMGMPGIELPGLILKPYDYENKTAKFDLNLTGLEKDGKLIFNLEYSTKLFKKETALGLSNYFKNLIDAICQDPEARISDVGIMSKEEKERILAISNGMVEVVDFDETIHGMFEKITVGNEDKTALVFKDAQITYGELNQRANLLAQMLQDVGVGIDCIVGLMVERSFELVIGMIGIMKAGGAYLPIDPNYPQERIDYMLKDSNARVLLRNNCQLSIVNDQLSMSKNQAFLHYSKLAYVIYTSGSTGRPKGAMLEHINLVNLIRFHNRYTGINCSKVLQFATISFDASFHEIFSALLAGGELYLIDEEIRNNIPALLKYIGKNKIKTVFLPMAFVKIIFNDDEYISTFPRGVEHIQTAGEQVVVSGKFKNYLKANHIYLHNHYGPSETHVITTFTVNPQEDAPEFPSIGKPIRNTGIYILDKAQQLLPIGVAGELYAEGLQVGRGYLNNPEITADRFTRGTFEKAPAGTHPTKLLINDHSPLTTHHSPIYRTGDLARWQMDGNIEFLGRIDQQVKIRGIRVEPGEIESQLKKIEIIKDAIVVVKQDTSGEKYLCAYIVLNTGTGFNDLELRNILAVHLPAYMIPSYFVQMEKMPLSPSGKIDRRALPGPELKSNESYIAPRNDIEKKLVEIWSEVLAKDTLNTSPMGIDDNFFQLGGNSLKAIILLSKVHKIFAVKIPLSELFKHPRIRELAGYIKNAVSWQYEQIELAEKKEYYSLSSAQKRLYFLQQMDKDGTAYNLSSAMILAGSVDENKLAEVVKKLIGRHESFRTSFVVIDEEPVQRIYDEAEYKSFAELFQKRPLGEPPEAIIKSFTRPFDLSRAPLLRVGLVRLAEEKHLFLVNMHHIISDGMSIQVLVQDFSKLYAGIELPGIKYQYKDYAEWQNREKLNKKIQEQGLYWKKEFEGEIPVLELPLDFTRPEVQEFEGNSIHFEISRETSSALNALALETGTTLYIVLVALYTILLSKLSNREDIVVGSPVAGRRHADLEKIIGMFVNTLALRNYPVGEKRFINFLEEVKDIVLKGFENQEYQYEELIEQIAVNRDAGRNPFFDTMFVLQNTGSQEIEIPGIKLLPYEYENKTAKFDLTLSGVEKEGKLFFTFEYSTKLFREETVQRFSTYFKKILNNVIENKDRRISDFEIITEEEKKRILIDFNDTEAEYPKDKTIHQLFVEQAAKAPDHIALVWVGTVETLRATSLHITYLQLNQQSDRLAGLLIEKGVLADTIVGIMMERCVEMVIGVMAILKAGGAYLPIDPEYPRERIDYMLKDSNAAIILTDKKEINCQFSIVNCQLSMSEPRASLQHLAFIAQHSNHLAYIIYTSGTTGRPKGSLIEHRNVVRLLFNDKFKFNFTGQDVWTLFHSFCFDFSVWEMYGALLYGGKLLILTKMMARDTVKFLELLNKEAVTVLNQTPSAFYNLINETLNAAPLWKKLYLRYIIFGGEALNPLKLKSWVEQYPQTRLINMYGITETTVHVTYKEITGDNIELKISNIGKPIPTLSIYLLDKYLKPVPLGVTGEIYVGGDGVARGYLNRPELTRGAFGPQITLITKINRIRETKMNKSFAGVTYKTGDLGRYLVDGDIEYLGRIDQQVKIRGFRIELGEIESRLMKHPGIKDAAVLAIEENGDKYLSAYIVFNNESVIPGLREYLSKELPEYMIPSYFISLEKIPLTSNGKLDRKSLPKHELKVGESYMAPRNEIERKLVEIWSDILSRNDLHKSQLKTSIGIDNNFFQLGGHSLKATVLVSKIHRAFDVNVPLTEIFKTPTIQELANYIEAASKDKYISIEPVEKKEYYELSYAQTRLWILYKLEPENPAFNLSGKLTLKEKVEPAIIRSVFEKLIKKHDSFRTYFLERDDRPVQIILPHSRLNLEIIDLTPMAEAEREESRRKHILEEHTIPFNLKTVPLFRVKLIKCREEEYDLLLTMHHIISDGWSQGILAKEFFLIYESLKKDNGCTFEPKPLRIQYKDYVEWHNRLLADGEKMQAAKESWRNQLKNQDHELQGLPALELPYDFPLRNLAGKESAGFRFVIPGAVTAQLKVIARENNASLFMVLMAGFKFFLAQVTGQQDIIIGVPGAARQHEDLQDIIGFFIETLMVRNQVNPHETFTEFLGKLQRNFFQALEYQSYPLELICSELKIKYPTISVFFNMLTFRDLSGETLENLESRHSDFVQDAKFNIVCYLAEFKNGIEINTHYYKQLFKPGNIEKLMHLYTVILERISSDPGKKLSGYFSPEKKLKLSKAIGK